MIVAEKLQEEIIDDFDSLSKLHDEVKAFKINNSAKILAMFRSSVKPKFYKTIYLKNEVKSRSKKSGNIMKEGREKRAHLSITSSCVYTLAQYSDLWKEAKQDVFNNEKYFKNLTQYWNYIIRTLAEKREVTDAQAVDEFTALTVLSLAREIQQKTLENDFDAADLKTTVNDESIISKAVNALCFQFIENQLDYVEPAHPFIYYKLLMTLNAWKERIDSKGLRERLKVKYGKAVLELYPAKKTVVQHKDNPLQTEPKCDLELFYWFWDTIYRKAKYELYRQVAFHESKEKSLFDTKRLVYSLLIVSWKNRYSNTLLANRAIDIIFEEQLNTGLLPISHVVSNDFVMTPIPSVENKEDISEYRITEADPITSPVLSSFECFCDMLKDENIRKKTRKYYLKFALAYKWANERLRKNRDNQLVGWYPEYESTDEPYSWVASHVLMFIKEFCSFISEIINEKALAYFNATKVGNVSIYDTYNVKKNIEQLKTQYCSALVFGPPGTGKSTIARYLALELGREDDKKSNCKDPLTSWDYIEITPGQFLDAGEDKIIPRANEIFKRLNRLKKAVVLFDEVDLLVANRATDSKQEKNKSWIVPALLPKFTELRDQGKIRFILATNSSLGDIDPAIMRVGRIDLILPMGGVSWKDRIKMLKTTIDKIKDSKIGNGLLIHIFGEDIQSKIINSRDAKKVCLKTSEEIQKEEIALLISFLTDEKISTDKSLQSLHCFLYRTNYLSQPKLRFLLQNALELRDEKTSIFDDPNFKELFDPSYGEDYPYNEDEFVKFHRSLGENFVKTHIRFSKLENNKSIDVRAKENIHLKQLGTERSQLK